LPPLQFKVTPVARATVVMFDWFVQANTGGMV
jgi:hypothetical protein